MVYLKTVVDLTLGMAGMILLLRVTGKKSLSDITPFDLVYILMLGGILEQVIYEENRPITFALWGFLVWGVLILILEKGAVYGDRFRRKLKGRPSILTWNGKLNRHELERNHIELEQLRTLIRKNGSFSLKRVEQLVLEIDGQASIIENPDVNNYLSYFLIDEGAIEGNVLKTIGKDEKWLVHSLQQEGFSNIKDIYYCEWSPEEGFYVQTYEETIGDYVYIDG